MLVLAGDGTLLRVLNELRDGPPVFGLNYGTLRTWRAGVRSPSPENMRRIAEIADRQADKLRGLAVELRREADNAQSNN